MTAPGIAEAPARDSSLIESMQGGIRIDLRRDGDACAVRLDSTRPLHAVRALQALGVEQALQALPRLFGVCGRAHRAACAAALDMPAPDDAEALRAENLREHLLRVHMDWPMLLGTTPDGEVPARLVRACERLRLEPAQALALIERHSLGVAPREFLDIDDVAGLRAWSARHAASIPAAAMLAYLATLPRLGPAPRVPALQDIDLARARARLDSPQAAQYVAQPDCDGECRETGVHARHADAPLLRALRERGRELEARFAARLLELAQVALDGVPAPRRQPGIAQVQTSRGILLHRVALDARQRIERWRVVAPTEWNFHPRGVAVQLLRAIPAQLPTSRRRELARLVVHAVDPCVAFDLTVDRPIPD